MSLQLSVEQDKIFKDDKSDLGGSDLSGGLARIALNKDKLIIADLSNFDKRGKNMAAHLNGFIKFHRSPAVEDLIKHYPLAFVLLSVIAQRAKRTNDFSAQGLEVGEAFIGDHKNYGMTRRQYRTGILKLVMYGFLTIKTTNRGTIAKLLDNNIFDINSDDQEASKVTNKRPLTRMKEYTPQPLINEGLSPIVLCEDVAPKQPSKKVRKPKKRPAEKIEREAFVHTTVIQHEALVTKYGDVLVSLFYKKLSEWKIGKGIGKRPNDYRGILNWVVAAVENELAKPAAPMPDTPWAKNQQFVHEVMSAFPEKTEGMYFYHKSKVLRHRGHSFDLSGEMPPEDFMRLVCKHLKISMEVVSE